MDSPLLRVWILVLALAIAVSIAYYIVASLLNSSNNSGDSKGKFRHFSKNPIKFKRKGDRYHSFY